MNELTLINPKGDMALVDKMSHAILSRRDEIALEIDASPITKDNYDAPETEEAQKKLKAIVEELRDAGKDYVERLLTENGSIAVVNAIDPRLVSNSTKLCPTSAYGSLSARLKERDAAIKAFKEAALHEKPERWTFGVKLLPSQKKKIMAAIERAGGVVEFCEIVKKGK